MMREEAILKMLCAQRKDQFMNSRIRTHAMKNLSILVVLSSCLLLPLTASAASGKCYSAKNCSGKVLSKRDAHNCKVKDRGKSWLSDVTGKCTNL